MKPYDGDNMVQMYQQAQIFWNKLDSVCPVFVIIFILVGILMAYMYYGPYNEQPHRHYLVKHWAKFLGFCAVVSLVATFVVAYVAATPRVNGYLSIEILLAIGNTIYSVGIFFVTSLVWCNCKRLPTNAYRFWKFNKKK